MAKPGSLSAYAEAIADARAKRRTDIRSADALARRPQFFEERAKTRARAQEERRASDSIADIFERAHAMGFLTEDDVRTKMRKLSSLLNAPMGTLF